MMLYHLAYKKTWSNNS